MPEVAQPRMHHLAVTVTDLEASVAWYGSIFDVHPVMDVPHPGGVGRILAGHDQQLMIALHRHDANDRQPFAETRTGLDHAGFTVPTRPTWNSGRNTWSPTASCALSAPIDR